MGSLKIFRVLSSIVAVLAAIVSATGLFWVNSGKAFYVNNIYGASVKMYGNGLYAYDSYFKAPINRGTDFVTLFIAVPILIFLILRNKKGSLKFKLPQLGILSYFLYYSASLALGVSYNMLFPIYILFFSVSLFSFMTGIMGIKSCDIINKIGSKMPRRGIAVFMVFAGMSVFVWLIEIVAATISGKPPVGLGIYTTDPTSVFDLGIIAPSAFTSAVLLFRKKPLGYIFAAVLLVLNSIIGIVVISQTLFQSFAGITLSLGAFIAFVGVFVVMSLVAMILNIKLLKNIEA